jgi:hypothetical protein
VKEMIEESKMEIENVDWNVVVKYVSNKKDFKMLYQKEKRTEGDTSPSITSEIRRIMTTGQFPGNLA